MSEESSGGEDTTSTATVPGHTPPLVEAVKSDFKASIPEEYKALPFLEGVENVGDLIKKTQGAYQLAGKKGIPTKESTSEDWADFYKTMRPHDPSGYSMQRVDETDGGQERSAMLREAFHKAGLAQNQADILEQELNGSFDAGNQQSDADIAAEDAKFEEEAFRILGSRKDQAMDNGKRLLEEFGGDDINNQLAGLSNSELVAVSVVLDGIARKYIGEDRLSRPAPVAGETKDGLHSEILKIRQSDEYKNQMHPRHKEVFDKVNSMYVEHAKMT